MAQASARVAGPCFAMGEAAGTAAAMCVQGGGPMRALEVQDLQERLEADGAILTPELA